MRKQEYDIYSVGVLGVYNFAIKSPGGMLFAGSQQPAMPLADPGKIYELMAISGGWVIDTRQADNNNTVRLLEEFNKLPTITVYDQVQYDHYVAEVHKFLAFAAILGFSVVAIKMDETINRQPSPGVLDTDPTKRFMLSGGERSSFYAADPDGRILN